MDNDELQEMATENARETYSEKVIDHATNPRNAGEIPNADGRAVITGSCGDVMGIWLRTKNETIRDISFVTDGCGTSIASGSMVTEMAKGKSISEGMNINQEDVLDALGGLPEESRHCALLAANTLKAAIRDCLAMKREPWKKAYRQ
ncbi:iron-sulfur cluster assembly scaffold protein [Chloroflexota bacterium]